MAITKSKEAEKKSLNQELKIIVGPKLTEFGIALRCRW